MNKHKHLKLSALALGAIAVVIVFLAKGHLPHEPFDSEKWKNWKESEVALSLRWDMMNSLRSNYSLIGKSKSEIIELLGEPELKGKFEYSYYLGYSGRGINTGSLIIKFDSANYVIHFLVHDG